MVHYDEGIANHIGPEPCVVSREAGGEASAGVRIGQPSSRERINRDADAVVTAEGETGMRVTASASSACPGLIEMIRRLLSRGVHTGATKRPSNHPAVMYLSSLMY